MLIALVALTSLATAPRAAVAQQDGPYHILLTNDDGIRSPGIQALAHELRRIAEVHVIAPCGQRSGSSMAIDLRQTVQLTPVEVDGEVIGHCVDATPAGAVLLGLTTLAPEGGFDLVVSGINAGANVGELAHMSGTVGGAMMGAFYRVPAVAASLGGRISGFEYPAAIVARFVEEIQRRPPLSGIVLSINIPGSSESDVAGVRVTPMGGSYMRFEYEEAPERDGGRRFRPMIQSASGHPAGSDTEAFMAGFITITPIAFDWTAHGVIDALGDWDLDHRLDGR